MSKTALAHTMSLYITWDESNTMRKVTLRTWNPGDLVQYRSSFYNDRGVGLVISVKYPFKDTSWADIVVFWSGLGHTTCEWSGDLDVLSDPPNIGDLENT